MNNSILDSLDSKTKIQLLTQMIGFDEIPVDIMTFIHDPYYLGNDCGYDDELGYEKTYDVWREALCELFPDPITMKSSFVCNTGAIGTGKSNCAKIIILYLLYKMSCCKNFFALNRLTPREIVIGISHNNKYQADTVIKDLNDMMDNSPYFTEQKNNPDSFISKYVRFVSCRSPNDFVGTNMPIWFGTELNDYKPQERALELINAAISRLESRFKRSFNMFSCIILDSSDRGVDSAVPIFLKENAYGREAVQFRYSHWEAKPSEYWHKVDKNRIDKYEYLIDSKNRKIKNENFGKYALSFRVYCGDSEIHPCIITDEMNQDLLDKMDKDRFIDVPNEVRNAFETDIELALQEKCGKATETTAQYFNPKYVVNSFTLENNIHRDHSEIQEDILCCSFFNPNDQYFNYLKDAIDMIPKNRACYLALDWGLTRDRAGVAIGYIKDIGERNNDGIIDYDPIYSIPIAFAISRNPGEETSYDKIIALIKWVHQRHGIHTVSTDHFQSYAIEQACLSMQINHEFITVDDARQGAMNAWKCLKDAMYRGKIEIIKNNVLKNELLNLYYDEERNKVDHHEKMNSKGDIGSNSKDIADALCKLVYNMKGAIGEDANMAITPTLASDSVWNEYTQEYTNALLTAYNRRQIQNSIRRNLGRKH